MSPTTQAGSLMAKMFGSDLSNSVASLSILSIQAFSKRPSFSNADRTLDQLIILLAAKEYTVYGFDRDLFVDWWWNIFAGSIFDWVRKIFELSSHHNSNK